MNFLVQAKALKDWSVKHRRYLHQHPEKSLDEENTAKYCQQVLTDLGYVIKPAFGYGFTAELKTPNPNAKKTIALRADMDALPIAEQNTHDFVSKNPGIGHMCGHDVHMAIALTTARLLAEQANSLSNRVRFIFQPNEETVPGGAIGMVESGCLDGVDEIFGLHNEPSIPVGKIHTRVGAITAAADIFNIRIQGHGCHAAKPHTGLDPIPIACSLVNQWQSIIPRHIDPMHTAVLSISKIHGGDVNNVIPDEISLGGTIRTFDANDKKLIQQYMQTTLDGLVPLGYRYEFDINGNESIINHAESVARIQHAGESVIGAENTNCDAPPFSWGEDFYYYLKHCKGAFYILGSGNTAAGVTEPLHSSTFDADENAIPIGVAIMANLVMQPS